MQDELASMPLDDMTGEQFEDYLKAGFLRLGYAVEMTPGYSDYGGDLILSKDGEKTAVQAKRQQRNVGVKAVQQAIGAKGHYECEHAMVVCNRPFTKQAINLARGNDVELWNRFRLAEMFGPGEIKPPSPKPSGVSKRRMVFSEDVVAGEVTDEIDPAEQEALRLIEQLRASEARDLLHLSYWNLFDPETGTAGPYSWQKEFHDAGADTKERCIIAANRVGKTQSGAAEMTIHLTGDYPPWWEGRRFTRPIRAWIGSDTNETSREIVQAALLGDERGTGWIPGDSIVDVTYRQAGIADVVDTITVRHASGGISRVVFKTYEQGRKKWQGTKQDVVWFDEEPPQDVFSEGLTRTLDAGGSVYMTFTPLNGASDVVMHFLDGGKGIWYVNATWDDAPHLSEEDKQQMMASYAEFERDTRARGVPLAGTGVVYPVPDDDIIIEPFKIPTHYRRIVGVDFGMDHPGGAVWIAYDADLDIVYVYDCYKIRGQSAAYHSQAIKSRGDWIPVAWPHDGMQREKGSGKPLADSYRAQKVNMLPESARYDDDKGGPQAREPIVQDIDDRMRTGRIKVFSTLSEWFREKRMYHRDDGQIVAEHDDLMSATNYAVMMKRHARNQIRQVMPTQGEDYDPFETINPTRPMAIRS